MQFQIACTFVYYIVVGVRRRRIRHRTRGLLRSGTMAVRGPTLLAMLCLLSTFAAGREILDANKKHSGKGKGKHNSNLGSMVRFC